MERVRLGLFSVSTPGDEMCDDERMNSRWWERITQQMEINYKV